MTRRGAAPSFKKCEGGHIPLRANFVYCSIVGIQLGYPCPFYTSATVRLGFHPRNEHREVDRFDEPRPNQANRGSTWITPICSLQEVHNFDLGGLR